MCANGQDGVRPLCLPRRRQIHAMTHGWRLVPPSTRCPWKRAAWRTSRTKTQEPSAACTNIHKLESHCFNVQTHARFNKCTKSKIPIDDDDDICSPPGKGKPEGQGARTTAPNTRRRQAKAPSTHAEGHTPSQMECIKCHVCAGARICVRRIAGA